MTALEEIAAAEAAAVASPSDAKHCNATPGSAMQRPGLPCLATPRQAEPGNARPRFAKPRGDAASYHRKMARVLDRMGGLYRLDDILTAVHENRLQSFARANSWALTQIIQFPRARVLQIIAIVGDINDIDALQAQILDYANQNGCGLISAYGRRGWIEHAQKRGWRVKARSYLYHKDV
jgi:hypothetical protein